MDNNICYSCETREIDTRVSKCFCYECNFKCSHCGDSDIYPYYGIAPQANLVNYLTLMMLLPLNHRVKHIIAVGLNGH